MTIHNELPAKLFTEAFIMHTENTLSQFKEILDALSERMDVVQASMEKPIR